MIKPGRTRLRQDLAVLVGLILSGILLLFLFIPPSEHSLQASCAENERQIGEALIAYAQDYDNRWPSVSVPGAAVRAPVTPAAEPAPSRTLDTRLEPFLKSRGVWECPLDGGGLNAFSRFMSVVVGGSYQRQPRSYAYAGAISTRGVPRDHRTGLVDVHGTGFTGDDVADPGQTIALVEAWGDSVGVHEFGALNGSLLQGCDTWELAGRRPADNIEAPPSCGQFNDPALLPTPGHFQQGNYLFADAHAASMPWQRVADNDFALFKRRLSD